MSHLRLDPPARSTIAAIIAAALVAASLMALVARGGTADGIMLAGLAVVLAALAMAIMALRRGGATIADLRAALAASDHGLDQGMRELSRLQDEVDEAARGVAHLLAAKEAAEKQAHGKMRFLAAASHDLRQPLQALGLFVAVLSDRPLAPEDGALVGKISNSVEALESLLNSLLDISKLEAGAVEPQVAAFPLAPLFSQLASEFIPLAEDKGLELRVVASRAWVRSDPALLDRILRNLLSNAVRYTRSGRILLGCRRTGGGLTIVVRDSGIGIPADRLDDIFGEFTQIDHPGRQRGAGLGLGLAIVERTAALLGHTVTVWSRLDHGSQFAVAVPLALVPAPVAPAPPISAEGDFAGCFTLVIEDDPAVRDGLSTLLSAWGCRVAVAESASEAILALGRAGAVPHVILADLRLLDGASGGEAIMTVRTHVDAPVPGILVSGDTTADGLAQARLDGFALLHKPVRPDRLREVLNHTLAAARRQPARAAAGAD